MEAITLTPLEAILIGAAISFLTALGVRIWAGGNFVSKEDCAEQAERMNGRRAEQSELLEEQKKDFKLIFSMLRAIVLNLPNLDAKDKEKILNMKRTE